MDITGLNDLNSDGLNNEGGTPDGTENKLDLDDPRLSKRDLALIASGLPILSHLFAVHARGH